ncbi:MAG: HD-GYP domain-containing protein [Desulfobacterales bacterium]
MDAIIEELSPDVIGKYLGQNIYSSNASLLLKQGSEIKEMHYSHLKEAGYQSIYLQPNADDNFDSDDLIISEDLRAKAPFIIKDIFKNLLNEGRVQLAKSKQELLHLAERILQEVQFRPYTQLRFLDLKRQDDYLYQHALNVALYSILIGHSLEYHQLKMIDLTLGALLHDFGKGFVDEAILAKATPLDEHELEQFREHTTKGFQYLGRRCQFNGLVTIVVLQHHERFDGLGFPRGLLGNEIHEYSRIVALADFFDTYTSDRPYRRLHPLEEAVEYIKLDAGKLFDPDIVQHFLKFFE